MASNYTNRPEAGSYILTHVGFSQDEEAILRLQSKDIVHTLSPIGNIATLRFDTSIRYCNGWYDLAKSTSSICPENNRVDKKYEQCSACQSRTGFNPAFYHARSISPQQEIRNREPHFLYLAYFERQVIKVGISHAARGRQRLLEQGARSAIILRTFETAIIARQYEAIIAKMPGIVESYQQLAKMKSLKKLHDTSVSAQILLSTRDEINKSLNISLDTNDVLQFDTTYFPTEIPKLQDGYDASADQLISGNIVGMIGSFLCATRNDRLVILPLKKLVGYTVRLSYDLVDMKLPDQQGLLF